MMAMPARRFRLLPAFMLGALLVLGQTSPAHAGPATDRVKGNDTSIRDLLKQSAPEAKKKVAALFNGVLDDAALSEASLGTEWASRTVAEKAQFSDLLKQLVRANWERNFQKTLTWSVDYLGEDSVDGAVMVKTKVKSPTDARSEPIEIAYKLAQTGGAWKIRDIVTEGVSLVSSYRSQFTKIIKKDGFPVLIQKMKDKLAKGDV
jgi:phospholipid transport system substrate-binding protein